jgi:hypothetical protein
MGAPALAIRQGVLPENTAGSHSSLALRLPLDSLPSFSCCIGTTRCCEVLRPWVRFGRS